MWGVVEEPETISQNPRRPDLGESLGEGGIPGLGPPQSLLKKTSGGLSHWMRVP